MTTYGEENGKKDKQRKNEIMNMKWRKAPPSQQAESSRSEDGRPGLLLLQKPSKLYKFIDLSLSSYVLSLLYLQKCQLKKVLCCNKLIISKCN
jgi:hypothetical protein